jgi:hypothetical protein
VATAEEDCLNMRPNAQHIVCGSLPIAEQSRFMSPLSGKPDIEPTSPNDRV